MFSGINFTVLFCSLSGQNSFVFTVVCLGQQACLNILCSDQSWNLCCAIWSASTHVHIADMSILNVYACGCGFDCTPF